MKMIHFTTPLTTIIGALEDPPIYNIQNFPADVLMIVAPLSVIIANTQLALIRLMFVCLCAKHLPSCTVSFKDPNITRAQRDDLLWWEAQLCRPFLGLHIIHPPPQLAIDISIYASMSWGYRHVR